MRVYSPAGKLFLAGVSLLFFGGCAVGPRYSRPSTPVPPAFKEVPQGWKQAHPSDQVLRGKWWEIFQDPGLNALAEQINVSNQTLRAAQAQFAQARVLVRLEGSYFYLTATVRLFATLIQQSTTRPTRSPAST